MSSESLQAFFIGIGTGVCIGVGVMLHWHLGRVRELWNEWSKQR